MKFFIAMSKDIVTGAFLRTHYVFCNTYYGSTVCTIIIFMKSVLKEAASALKPCGQCCLFIVF